jgi:hypothetical protein
MASAYSILAVSLISMVDEVEISWQRSEGMEEICIEIVVNQFHGNCIAKLNC